MRAALAWIAVIAAACAKSAPAPSVVSEPPPGATDVAQSPPFDVALQPHVLGRWDLDLETLEAQDPRLREILAVVGVDREKMAAAHLRFEADGTATLIYGENATNVHYGLTAAADGQLTLWIDWYGRPFYEFGTVALGGTRMTVEWGLPSVSGRVPVLRPDELTRVADELRQRCDQRDLAACNQLGERYELGRGVGRDLEAAVRLFDAACRGGGGGGFAAPRPGDARACANLAVLYRDGEGVPADEGREASLNQQACDRGDELGCYNLGLNYEEGRGVSRDRKRALEAFDKACAAGGDTACVTARSLRAAP